MTKIGTSSNSCHADHLHLLATASLLEGDFSIDWIMELTERKACQVLSALEEAVRVGWVRRKSPGIFHFVASRKQKMLHDHLTAEQRKELYRRIADLLLAELPEDDSRVEIVSHYLLHIPNDAEKCRCLMAAGDAHLKVLDNDYGLQCYIKVLNDLSGQCGEEADTLFIEAAIKYSKVSTARHDTKNVILLLTEAMLRAKRHGKLISQALLELHLAKNEWLCNQYQRALKHFEQGWSMANELDDAKLLRSATTFSTFFLYWQGRFKDAVRSYERSVPDVDKYPKGRFPILAAVTVGYCYAQIGQITQGLGMLDAIHKHCRERGNKYWTIYAEAVTGATLLDILRVDDAFEHLERAVKDASHEYRNDWVLIWGNLMLAYAHYLTGGKKRSVAYIREFLQQSKEVQVTVRAYPYLMNLSWAMEEGRVPHVAGLSLEREVRHALKADNIFMKGLAYRYQALLQRRQGLPHEIIFHSLNLSSTFLE